MSCFKDIVQDKLTQKPVKLIYGILRSKNSLEQKIILTLAVSLQPSVDG